MRRSGVIDSGALSTEETEIERLSEIKRLSIDTVWGLAMDAVQKASSGHRDGARDAVTGRRPSIASLGDFVIARLMLAVVVGLGAFGGTEGFARPEHT
jgi:hypothetical protein